MTPRHTPPPTSLPDWLPDKGLRRMSCGEGIDTVRVPRSLGEWALDVPSDKKGPVIESSADRRLHWLVAPRTLRPRLPFYEVGTVCRLAVPAPGPAPCLWLGWRRELAVRATVGGRILIACRNEAPGAPTRGRGGVR